MADLNVDLLSRDSLMVARAVIDHRLAELGEEPGSEREPAVDEEAVDGLSSEQAAKIAADLWNRIGGHTRDLVLAFAKTAEAKEPVSLKEIVDLVPDADYDTIKARKFRFGRTEKLINSRWNIELLPGVWTHDEGANRYQMHPDVAAALRQLAAES